MDAEIVTLHQSKSIAQHEEQRDAMLVALDEYWLDEQYMAKTIKYIIDHAVTATHKWDIIEDFVTKTSALKLLHKMRSSAPDVAIQINNVFPTGQNIL